jgi:ATP-binding cassette subfamily C (CFTR/MRP) protein 4
MSLVGFALLGNILTARQAFVVTAYYNLLRATMTVFFPQAISQLAETLVSVRRIQKFMLYDEVPTLEGGLTNFAKLKDDLDNSSNNGTITNNDKNCELTFNTKKILLY